MKAVWSYDSCLTPEQCEQAIAIGLALPSQEGTVGYKSSDPDSSHVDQSIRSSTISWLSRSDSSLSWLFSLIDHKVSLLTDHWHHIRYFYQGCDSLQFTSYSPGHYYNSHIDYSPRPDYSPVRKVSASVLLSPPDSFKGGSLVIDGGSIPTSNLMQGQITVFPSIINHHVTPVTEGTRYSLVAWYKGPPWI